VYYKCAKFHKNPISGLGGVALTRYMDGWTDRQGDSYIPPQTLCGGGINMFFNFSVSFTSEKEMKFFINIVSYAK
jgi:hypothetical protein